MKLFRKNPSEFSPINYLAIEYLNQMGFDKPSERMIEDMEQLIGDLHALGNRRKNLVFHELCEGLRQRFEHFV